MVIGINELICEILETIICHVESTKGLIHSDCYSILLLYSASLRGFKFFQFLKWRWFSVFSPGFAPQTSSLSYLFLQL